ncbi:MAG: endonuclease/exonuclease/phosphatase family protein [Arcanobacterium sp.]|nr:endonuclease/exonuclease/phosphatase family protein [Arcanobacterium sp.]
MLGTIIFALFAIVLGLSAVATVFPSILQWIPGGFSLLDTPLVQIIAFRVPLAISLLLLTLVTFVFVAFGKNFLRRLVALLLGFLLAGTTLIHGITVAQRGFASAEDFTHPEHLNSEYLNILSYNTLGGATSYTDLLPVIQENDVDVVALLETQLADGLLLQKRLRNAGEKFQIFSNGSSEYDPAFKSTLLLVRESFGEYRVASETNSALASQLAIEPVDGEGPRFIAVHPIAPLPELIGAWRSEVAQTYQQCASSENFVMMGDFNSTYDHQSALGANCVDGAAQANSGALGTWPTWLPQYLAAPIDRVLHSGLFYRGVRARTVNVGESDHRGILVQLRTIETSTV